PVAVAAAAGAIAGAARTNHQSPRRRRSRPGPESLVGNKFYLTTAIDYANGDPHLGHALEKVGADAIARYRRLAGDDVHFLMGMDEHGQKVKQAADEEGVSPQAFVDRVATTFEDAWRSLAISNNQFIRTTDPAHKRGVKALIERIHEKNPD